MANPTRRGGSRGRRSDRFERSEQDLEQIIVEINRVTRVMAGGKRMSFRAVVVVGDKKGKVGMGVRKGADVSLAIRKAVSAASKHLITVPIVDDTIPYAVHEKFGAAKILLKPAPKGAGIIAGGPIRAVLTLAGIRNIVAKMLGSHNKLNNMRAVISALEKLKTKERIATIRKVA